LQKLFIKDDFHRLLTIFLRNRKRLPLAQKIERICQVRNKNPRSLDELLARADTLMYERKKEKKAINDKKTKV
jgi:hypothetical protein